MKILSWNVNGLRAIYKRNFLEWLKKENAEIVCLQEIKAQKKGLPAALTNHKTYHSFFNQAQKKGYSGVLVYTKQKPLFVEQKLGLERFDKEGRMLRLDFGDFILINLYLPHGGRQKENLEYKLDCYRYLIKYLEKFKDKKVLLIGDFNIAHREIDLARPKENQNNIMFTPQEREQIDKITGLGFIDTFRKFHQEGGNYTWWPYWARARQRNLGWRIDYVFISAKMTAQLQDGFILKEMMGSDHCPIGIELDQ